MAKNNEVMAKVTVTIGGVPASKKNLETLKITAESLRKEIDALKKERLDLIDKNNMKEADKVIKKINKLSSALQDQKNIIKLQEAELTNYTNILHTFPSNL